MITINDILKRKKEELQNLERIKCIRNKKIYNLKEFLTEKPFICEIKRKSPLKGTIKSEINAVETAKQYEINGAGAISVLTDKTFFSGDMEELYEISKVVKLPILCKDFILTELQILNAHISGADVILIIVSILNDEQLEQLVAYSRSMNLSILFEVCDLHDFKRIKRFNPEFIGVNSRNLKTMQIEKQRSSDTIKKLSDLKGDFLIIAESGITSGNDVSFFRQAGADAFLIGTALMESNDLKLTFKEFHGALAQNKRSI